jgi:hypothetical protein
LPIIPAPRRLRQGGEQIQSQPELHSKALFQKTNTPPLPQLKIRYNNYFFRKFSTFGMFEIPK